MKTQTSNTLYNAIMEAGDKDRPPMLAPGNYVQWKSRIKRYIDTKPNHELIYCCLNNPPYKYTWADKVVPVSEDNDIYSTVDACPTACEMWKAIERLKQGESINFQDLETNLYWVFGKFTSRDGESLESYYSRFYKMMNELVRNQYDEMSKDKEIDKLMALIYLSFKKIYKPTNNNLRTSSNTSRANQDNSPWINRGTVYEHQRIGNVVGARETVGTTMVQKSGIQCYNCKEFGHVARECQKPERANDAAYHREKMLLCFYDETLFSLKIHHGGFFTEPPGYKSKKNKMYYHFKIPNNNLDHGLQSLGNDADAMNLVSALARKPFKKPDLKVNRLPQLLLEGPSLNDDVEVPSFNEDENSIESNEEAANEDKTSSESSESSESDDSDYIVDTDNVINEVDVDMQEFYQNIDKDVEWVGQSKGNVEVLAQVDVEEGFDLNDFDMDIDCDSDNESSKERKRALRALKKEQLYVWKNDKLRIRAVCRGKCPNSVGPNASKLNSPNKGKLKQVNGKWVKSKTVKTSCSGQGINKVDGIRIKVCGKKGSYVYDTITCLWSLQISKENNTWTVKTYKDEHTCLQTREVKLLTDKWLSNQIEDIVKPNPSIPVKALKEQLHKKYQVGISTSKVKRAWAASIMKVKGDFSKQYSMLRDYVLELQRTNEDTIVKIDLERDYNPSETTRQFKRIYVCIRALKGGFKEGLRGLLGLDGCFIKGQYPGDDLDLNPMSNFTFISDRQKGIIPTIAQVFPNAEPRDVSIITCLEFVREYLMKRIVNVKKVISKSPGVVEWWMKGHNKTSCKGSQASKVGGSQALKVMGSQTSKVGGSQASSVEGSKASSVVPAEGQVLPPDVLNTHSAWVKASEKIDGDQELLQTLREFYACKQEEGQFNYNMHSMGKTVTELHAMLKLHEQTLPPKEVAPALHDMKAKRIQKNQKKKPHKAAKGNQRKGKVKMGNALVPALSFTPKPKNPPTPKKDNPAKDAICHQCGEGLRGSKKLKPGALSLYVSDGHRATVEAIEEFHLCLPNTSLYHEEDDQEIDEPQSDINPIRRSTRTGRTPDRMCLYVDAEEHELGDLSEPANYKAALLDPKSNKWLNAMNVEIAIHTYKTCLVAKGFTQTPGIDYKETFSLVADIRAIRIVIAIAVFYDYKIWQIDVKNAFLNGYLNEEVYMEQPEGFVNQKFPNRICKLKRSIYGLKQASRQWNKRFDDEIKKFGFSQNCDEPCVYIKASETYVTFLILYVDDILIMGNNIPMLQDVKSYLGRCFSMKDLGKATYILRIKIYQDRSKRLIGLCQSAYIEKILKRYYMENSKRRTIPMQEKLKFSKSQGDTKRELRVSCYTDATDLRDADDIKSQTGYVFILNGGVVDWKSMKQSIFATTSTYAEYIATFDASKEVVRIHKFISGLGVVPTIEEPINMYCDNTGAIAIAKDHGVTKGARHFRAKVHYFRETIEIGAVKNRKS
nr:hypothetical protein [Tanacetum cinerariifolium]